MNLIQTKCRIRKSLKTHLSTVTNFCTHLVQQLLGSTDSAELASEPEAILRPLSGSSLLSLEALGSLLLPDPLLAIMLSQQMLPNLDEELSSKLEDTSSAPVMIVVEGEELAFFILFQHWKNIMMMVAACFPW